MYARSANEVSRQECLFVVFVQFQAEIGCQEDKEAKNVEKTEWSSTSLNSELLSIEERVNQRVEDERWKRRVD